MIYNSSYKKFINPIYIQSVSFMVDYKEWIVYAEVKSNNEDNFKIKLFQEEEYKYFEERLFEEIESFLMRINKEIEKDEIADITEHLINKGLKFR